MLPILHIGPVALPMPQFSLILAFWLGLSLAEKFSPRQGISADALYNLAFTSLITGLIAARLGYVLQHPSAFIQSPLSLISPNIGLFSRFSALGGVLIGMLVYGQRAKLQFWNTLDALTPLLAVMAIGLAAAHIASGEAFGAETSLPWGVELWGAKRHPTQFYELAAALFILILLAWRAKANIQPGILFFTLIGLHAGSRLFIEGFPGDSSLILGGIRSAQLAAWAILSAAILGMEWIKSSLQHPQKEDHVG